MTRLAIEIQLTIPIHLQEHKILSLKQLALSEISACGRNWYLTEALCEDGLVIKPSDEMRKKRIYSGNLYDLFLLLTVLLDFEKTLDVVESACFHFTDIDEHFIFKVCISSMHVYVFIIWIT